jgi:hypothetical protein
MGRGDPRGEHQDLARAIRKRFDISVSRVSRARRGLAVSSGEIIRVRFGLMHRNKRPLGSITKSAASLDVAHILGRDRFP